MKINKLKTGVTAALALVLSGCSLSEGTYFDSRSSTAGPTQLLPASDARVDLTALLDPTAYTQTEVFDKTNSGTPGAGTGGAGNNNIRKNYVSKIDTTRYQDPGTLSGNARDIVEGHNINIALDKFYSSYTKPDQKLKRNRVQEALLAESNQRCNLFQAYIHRLKANGDLTLGSLATVLGGVGAIVSDAASTRIFSGASAAFSGLRAEFDQDLFANLTIGVISEGIEVSRKDYYREVISPSQNLGIEDYTVEAAIKDAIFYHGNCSMVTGLRTASKSLHLAENPGLEQMQRALTLNAQINYIKNLDRKGSITRADLDDLLTLGKPTPKTSTEAGKSTPTSGSVSSSALPVSDFSIKDKLEATIVRIQDAPNLDLAAKNKLIDDLTSKANLLSGATLYGRCTLKSNELLVKIAKVRAILSNPNLRERLYYEQLALAYEASKTSVEKSLDKIVSDFVKKSDQLLSLISSYKLQDGPTAVPPVGPWENDLKDAQKVCETVQS